MVFRGLLLLALFGLSYQASLPLGPIDDVADFAKEFKDFIKNFKRAYKDANEEKARFENFKENMKELLEIKKQLRQGNADFGVNELMDKSKEEKANLAKLTSVPHQDPSNTAPPKRVKRQAPSSFNWQSSNIITPVKNQGNCGSCWAFATVAVVEALVAKSNGTQVDMSEQALVDCSTQNSGCNGGWPPYALAYLRANGVPAEAAYPYKAVQGACQNGNFQWQQKVYNNDWWYVGTDESQLTYQLYTKGPLVYTMWVPNSMFYLTSTSGVYYPSTTECQAAKNASAGHAVAVVGYGVDSATGYPYWLIKNSWGTGWGNAGFFKLYRGNKICSMGNSMWAAQVNGPQWTCANAYDEDDCKYWQGLGYCATSSQYSSFMQTNCKAACGFCSTG